MFDAEGAVEMLLPPRFLRLRCQSAGTRMQLEGREDEVASDHGYMDSVLVDTIPADVHPASIEPRGNYAVAINWSDGHTGSIYPHDYLRQLHAQLLEMEGGEEVTGKHGEQPQHSPFEQQQQEEPTGRIEVHRSSSRGGGGSCGQHHHE